MILKIIPETPGRAEQSTGSAQPGAKLWLSDAPGGSPAGIWSRRFLSLGKDPYLFSEELLLMLFYIGHGSSAGS